MLNSHQIKPFILNWNACNELNTTEIQTHKTGLKFPNMYFYNARLF